MFASVTVACIRPGLGTVSDALLTGARIHAWYEDGNSEMAHIASSLVNAGVGSSFGADVGASVDHAMRYVTDGRAMSRHAVAVLSLAHDGVEGTAAVIAESLVAV